MADNKLNYVIFLILSIAIIFGYAYFFTEPQPPKPELQAEGGASPAPGVSPSPRADVFEGSVPAQSVQIKPAGKVITIDTPLYTGKIDTAGARIFKWDLKKYKDNTNGDSGPVDLFKDSPLGFSTLLRLEGYSVPEYMPFEFSGPDNVSVTDGTKEITFSWTSPEGIAVKKIYEINAATYTLKQRFEVTNPTPASLREKLDIVWDGHIEHHGREGNTKSFVALVSSDIERVDKKPKSKAQYSGVVEWFGYSQKYFISTFLPETGASTTLSVDGLPEEGLVRAVYSYPEDTIPPAKTATRSWEVYLGPLEYDIVKAVGYNLQESVNYGWVEFLAKPLLDFLKWLNGYFHNYGISIIVITIIIRLVFLPLTIRSMISMKKTQSQMEKLKPKMDAIKEKYKDDKAKQNSEIMKLYTSSGVNPLASLGGCFPLLIQLPVFIALYDVLLHSIDLRHSSFLWIQDLSEPETLFDIPGIGIPFRILPLLMGVSWFISQKMTPMTPAAGGESMQLQMKMMQFMPIIFTVMFWGLPSGLILYWTVSNILSIFQQMYVNHKVSTMQGVS
ncbi:MAG: membrane protein insertase YidC [Candidatus Dadabacteria bacterium]|nr:membrane protein insertase YidC [Candidatus Dadabacteria bacterium]